MSEYFYIGCMKQFGIGILGLLIGGLFGAMLGAGNTYYTKKSQKNQELNIQVPIFAIIGGIAGGLFGSKIGLEWDEEDRKAKANQVPHYTAEDAELNQRLQDRFKSTQVVVNASHNSQMDDAKIEGIIGIFPSDNSYSQRDGRWYGVTKWIDKINNKEYVMKTSVLVNTNHTQNTQEYNYLTTINGKVFQRGKLDSTNREAVIEVHEFSKRLAIQKMRRSYINNNQTDFNDIFNV